MLACRAVLSASVHAIASDVARVVNAVDHVVESVDCDAWIAVSRLPTAVCMQVNTVVGVVVAARAAVTPTAPMSDTSAPKMIAFFIQITPFHVHFRYSIFNVPVG